MKNNFERSAVRELVSMANMTCVTSKRTWLDLGSATVLKMKIYL